MQNLNINAIDLNLLRVFDAIFREGNVVRAAQRLGLSQPAVSHALGRLRHALNDDLFVRSAQGMLPTARADQLAHPVRQALNYLELGLQPVDFDPQTSKLKFRLALDNCSAVSCTSRIVEAVSIAAPGVSLSIRPSGTIDVDSMIDASELDLFIGRPGKERERFASEELSRDDFVVVHPAKGSDTSSVISPEAFVAKPHLHLSSAGDDTSFVDLWLKNIGLSRKVRYAVPLLGCTGVLQHHDALVVMRRPIADTICRNSDLVIRELPFQSPCISTCLRWHRRLDSQPAHAWLRQTIKSALTRNFETYPG